jgi:hypothetical protein
MYIMNPLNLFWLFAAPTKGWRHLVHSKPSIPQLYLAHVIPFSLLPALMVYLAGSKYSGHLVQILSLSHAKLLIVAFIMFIIELIVVPVMAVIIRQVGEVAQIHPSYREAFILAAVAPTPLWMAPLFFVVPDVMTNLVIMGVAMMAAVGLIYYGIPIVFHVHERGHTNLMFGAVLTAGVIAWVFLMVTTLVILGAMQSLQIAMPSL